MCPPSVGRGDAPNHRIRESLPHNESATQKNEYGSEMCHDVDTTKGAARIVSAAAPFPTSVSRSIADCQGSTCVMTSGATVPTIAPITAPTIAVVTTPPPAHSA